MSAALIDTARQMHAAGVNVIPVRHDGTKAPALKAWMRTRGLAAFKVPDQIVFVPSFQTTAVGKVNRNVLRAELRARYLAEENT